MKYNIRYSMGNLDCQFHSYQTQFCNQKMVPCLNIKVFPCKVEEDVCFCGTRIIKKIEPSDGDNRARHKLNDYIIKNAHSGPSQEHIHSEVCHCLRSMYMELFQNTDMRK